MGRLASGIAQVPVPSGASTFVPSPPDTILAALRSPQPVLLLKCGSDSKSRLLYTSQILLNDATERNQKIKIVATLKNRNSPKELANLVSSERCEKVIIFNFLQNRGHPKTL